MAGKIIIRRMGSIMPTLCLLLLLVVCVVVVWLSTVGFPGVALRYVERKAAEQGVTLRVEELHLMPSRGLALQASGVRVYADEQAEAPLATVGRVAAGVRVASLFAEHLQLSFMQVEQGELRLPVTQPEGEHLVVSGVEMEARMNREGVVYLSSGRLLLQGIPVKLGGSLDVQALLREMPESGGESAGVHPLPEPRQRVVNEVYRHIAEQHWQPGETPEFALRLDWQESPRVVLRGQIPRLDLGQFHFRDAELELGYNKRTLTLHTLSFHTVDPESTATFQGAYDVAERHLSFTMKSNAALLRMLRSLSTGELKDYLLKFRHPDEAPPHINLTGDVAFEEDFSLQRARVRGSVLQKELLVGSTPVDEVELSFLYDNGNFNIDKLELLFPDGSLRCVATASAGVGQAQVVADLPVKKMLTLVNELATQEVNLPEGLRLGERVNLAMQAQLTTPAFVPGQVAWQDFVPSFHQVGLKFKSDMLAYQQYELERPELQVRLSDIVQSSSLVPQSVGKVELHAEVGQGVLPQGRARGVGLELLVEGVELGAGGMPRRLQHAELSLQAAEAELPGERAAKLAALHSTACLEEVSLPEGAEGWRVKQAELQARAEDLAVGELRAESVELSSRVHENEKGAFSFKVVRGDAAESSVLSAEPDWSDPSRLTLRGIHADFTAPGTALLLDLLGISATEAEVPARLSLQGECAFFRETMGLSSGSFHLEIPELVRTPHKQPALRGARVPLGVLADVVMHGDDAHEGVNYSAKVEATHATGAFRGSIVGSTGKRNLRVTGQINIRPDVVDKIIDSADAHSIIRDFRFPEGGRVSVTQVDARIDYSNGLRVESDCHVDLYQTEYLISALEEAADGSSRLRRDLGSDPYTLVKHGTCNVGVYVRHDAKAADGTLLPKESVITISDIALDYNNTPWLRRRKFKGGVSNTRLEADRVVIDIERSFVELNRVRGSVYPAYSLGMFYPELYHILEDVILPQPVQMETPQCVFPIYSDCTRPMSGRIRVLAPREAKFRFLGTVIPMNRFSGFISLSDTHVLLDRLNARCWEGVLDAAVRIGISGKNTSFDGYAKAQCMNLKEIAAAYGSRQEPALCKAEIRFRSPSAQINALRAYGRVDIEDGDLMNLSLFRPVSELITNLPEHFTRLEKEASAALGRPQPEKPGVISRMFSSIFRGLGSVVGTTSGGITKTASYVPGLNHLIAYDLQEAHANFDIINGHFITRDMKAKGYNLNVKLNIDINLNTMELKGNLWPRISSLPTILLSPLTFLSDYMVDIIVYGSVKDIKWRIGLDRRSPSQPPSATTRAEKDNPAPRKKR